jgi:hypothetical protein
MRHDEPDTTAGVLLERNSGVIVRASGVEAVVWDVGVLIVVGRGFRTEAGIVYKCSVVSVVLHRDVGVRRCSG